MKERVAEFFEIYDYPQEAKKAVFDACGVLGQNDKFVSLLNNFYKDETIDIGTEDGPLYEIAKSVGANFYTAKLLFYICLSKSLKEEYDKAGKSEELYHAAIEDIHCKMMECFNVYGIWGLFSQTWFSSVFRMSTFALGRLFYNTGTYSGEEFMVGGRTVKPGDTFISVHIPSNGKPFDLKARLASYELAYKFYKESFGYKEPLFRCETWLLDPALKDILGEKSNIVSFMDDFKIVSSYEYPDNRDLWRIFGKDYTLPPEELPTDTSLRKKYADYLVRGNKPGAGIGFFVYDPINKTTLK